MFDVKGKRAIVTGAAQGFGKEFTKRLLTMGCSVCMSDVAVEMGEAARDEFMKQLGVGQDRVCFVKCDVSKAEDWTNLWDEAEKLLGGSIDVLCNNAGLHPGHGWELNMSIMGMGAARGMYMALEKMGKSKGGRGGRIINTASVAGLAAGGLGPIEHCGYNMAKWGVVSLTRSSAECLPSTWDSEGVKCYALCPWFADTNLVRSGFDGSDRIQMRGGPASTVDDLRRVTKNRILTVEEVGDSLVQALKYDKAGAVYLLYPDVPLIEYPHTNTTLLVYIILLGRFLGAKLNVDLITPRLIVVLTVLVLLVWYLLAKVVMNLMF